MTEEEIKIVAEFMVFAMNNRWDSPSDIALRAIEALDKHRAEKGETAAGWVGDKEYWEAPSLSEPSA